MKASENVFMMKVITERVKLLADEALEKHGLTSAQGNAIRHIYRVGGTTTQKELQEMLNISHSTCVGIVQRLENGGFIVTMPLDEDKRQKGIVLTTKATAINLDVDEILSKTEERLLSPLSDQEKETFYELLVKVFEQ